MLYNAENQDKILKENRFIQQNKIKMILSKIIFSSRWVQAPLYLGLILAQFIYVYQFLHELYHLMVSATKIDEIEIMLIVLGLIDVVMISNLLIMVIIGGYETFVSRLYTTEGHPDQPEWLDHVNANTMKIKFSMALVAISSIHLLKTFFNVKQMENHQVLWQVVIHIVFLISSMALAYTSKLLESSKKY